MAIFYHSWLCKSIAKGALLPGLGALTPQGLKDFWSRTD